MSVAKTILSVVASITIVVIGWQVILFYPTVRSEKATGLAVVLGGLKEMAHSPLLWLSVILLFFFFFYAGRSGSKILRVLLFWIPTISVVTVTSLIFALAVYAYLHRPNG